MAWYYITSIGDDRSNVLFKIKNAAMREQNGYGTPDKPNEFSVTIYGSTPYETTVTVTQPNGVTLNVATLLSYASSFISVTNMWGYMLLQSENAPEGSRGVKYTEYENVILNGEFISNKKYMATVGNWALYAPHTMNGEPHTYFSCRNNNVTSNTVNTAIYSDDSIIQNASTSVPDNITLQFNSVSVPKFFYDWIHTVFDDNTPKISFSILSHDGSATRLTRTLPQVTKYQASQSDGSQYFTFNSADGSFQNAAYEIPTVTGKKLVGYSTQPNSLIPEFPAVTNGKIDVNWDSDTVLYEVWDRAAPVPDTTFSINLYKSSAERKRVNKADYLTSVGTISGALRDVCSVQSPTILLEYAKFPDFNYVYIPAFGGRYYFVENVVSAGKNLWNISFTEDVLMSFKTGILKLSAVIERQENVYNLQLRDPLLPAQQNFTYSIIDSTFSFPFTTSGTSEVPNCILTVVGTGVNDGPAPTS